jgi:hypothetical protein
MGPDRWLKFIGLGVLIVLVAHALMGLPPETGKIDFRAYWSASYLLARGANFADESSLLAAQRELTGFDSDYAMKTWNPPWILVWLLPFTWVGFDVGATLWLMTNVGALLLSIVASWRMLWPPDIKTRRLLWLPVLVAILFPSTIVTLVFGQVNLMVLCGIVGFLVFLLPRPRRCSRSRAGVDDVQTTPCVSGIANLGAAVLETTTLDSVGRLFQSSCHFHGNCLGIAANVTPRLFPWSNCWELA